MTVFGFIAAKKTEHSVKTMCRAREVFEYIEVFYNRRRRHSTLSLYSQRSSRRISHHHGLEQLQTA